MGYGKTQPNGLNGTKSVVAMLDKFRYMFFHSARIPNVNDNVHIQATVSDQITLTSIVTIKTLDISGARLVVMASSQLTVTDRFIHSAERLDIYGVLLVKSFTWSGQYIYGASQNTGSGIFGEITVTDKMIIQKGSHGYKNLYDISLHSKTNLTVEQTLESSSSLTCSNCIIDIAKDSLFFLPGVDLYSSSTSNQRPTQSDGFRWGLINHGNVVMANQRSPSWRWDTRNYGNLTIVCVYYSNTYSVSFYGNVLFNNGTVRSYSSSLYFSSNVKLVSNEGSLHVYGIPGIYASNYNVIPGYRKPWLYEEYIHYVYDNHTYMPMIWDLNPTLYIQFSSFNRKEIVVLDLRTYGKVNLYLSGWQHSQMVVSGNLYMSPESMVQLGSYGSSSSYTNNTLSVGENATTVVFGNVYIGSPGYELQVNPRRVNVTFRQVKISGRFVVNSLSVTVTHELVIGPSGIVVVKDNPSDDIKMFQLQSLQAMGPAVFKSSSVTVLDRLLWKQSYIEGNNTLMYIRGIGEISGNRGKTLDGINVIIESPSTVCPKSGVIAEYFQYRVASATTLVISSINSYYYPGSTTSNNVLPQQFDNTSAVPTYTTIESAISRLPQYNGNAPLVFNDDDSNNINFSSPLSFTYNYAVRLFTFLKIDQTGNYKFYFISGRGRVRLWINDQVYFTGRSYTSFMEEEKTQDIYLSAGFHKLRVDNFIISSDWSTRGNMLYVLYEGPGVTKQTLPEDKQLFCKVNDTTGMNEYVTRNPRQSSYMSVGGEGLILSRNKASVTVEKSGQLDFVSNTVWYSSGNFLSTFYNYGVISKTGPLGSATVCGLYKNKGGTLILNSGNIDFKHPSQGGCAFLFWNNSAGGVWSNRYNWDPARVPDETDLVYITLPGSPIVVIPGLYYAHANSLIVGGVDSNPQLRVEFYGKLNVTDRMDIYSDTLIVRGTADVGQLTWSGKTIESGSTSATDLGVIYIHENFNILRGAISSKHINDMHIISKGNLTVDMSLYGATIEGASSKLSNLGYMLTIPISLQQSGQQVVLENNGTLAIDMRTRSTSWYWDVVNNGNFVLYCAYCMQGSSYYLSFYGKVDNKAIITSYGAGLIIYGTYSGKHYLGAVVVKGIPLWKSGAQNPHLQTYGNWSENVNELYREPVLWDVRYQTSVNLHVRSPDGYRFDSYRTYGNVYTTVKYSTAQSDSPALVFYKELIASEESTLYFRSTPYKPQIAFGDGASVLVDCLRMQGGWIMNLTGANFTAARYTVLESDSQLVSNRSADVLNLKGSVSLQHSSVFSVSRRDVKIDGAMSLAGTLEVNNGIGDITEQLIWTDGTLKGIHGQLNLHGGGAISSDYIKTMDGITVNLEVPKREVDYSGVVAEFFQYRLPTAVTPQISGISSYYVPGSSSSSGYLPKHFDNLTYTPNVVRLDSSLTRLSTRWGNGPIKYLTSGYGVDYSSPESFTYNYAVRYLTFLNIATSGTHRFYFITGRGRVRLWIDDKKVFEGRSYTSFLEEQQTSYYNLYAGYHRLRVDLFVTSSYWNSHGSMIIVKLEGPDTPKQILSAQNLTYAYQNGSNWVYASDHMPDERSDSVLSFAGEGLVVAKSGSVLNVTSSGSLQILDDVIYYSHWALGVTARIINSGVINKTGDAGVATFYAVYDNQGGQLIETMGDIEFLDADMHGGVALWNNPNGGSFLHSTNWVPPRVSRATDIVYVTLPGTYKLIITSATPVTVRSLILGSSKRTPDVLIGHLTTLVVTHRLDIHTGLVELQGSIIASHLSWSGSFIRGTAGIGKASITAQKTIVILRGNFANKQLSMVDLSNYGNMTIDQTMDNGQIYCQGCRVRNEQDARIISYRCYLHGSTNGASADNDGFVYGLINYGVFTQIWATSTSSVYMRWHLRNYGRIIWLNTYYGSRPSVYLREVLVNNGAIESYMVSLYFYSAKLPSSNGTWSIYGIPARQYRLRTPSWTSEGYNVGLQYDKFIYDMYHNGTLDVYRPGGLWKCCSVAVSFITNYGSDIRFNSWNTFGWVKMSFSSNSYDSRVYFDGTINLSENTEFQTYSSTSTRNNTITIGSHGRTQLGRLTYLSRGWTLLVKENATLVSLGDVSSVLDSYINISRGPDIVIAGQLIVQDSARLNVDNRRIIVKDGLYVASHINLTNSQIVSERMMRWTKGEIKGPSGRVFAQGGVDVYDQYFKTLNGATLSLDAKQWHSSSGVIAEYFQYRVQTDRTPRRSSLQYYYYGCTTCSNSVPQAFDDPTTASNVARIEKNVNRKPRLYGHGPLVYDQSGRSIDYSLAESFTYNYAVRFSAFFRVWYPGMHDFYFLTGLGQVRLWIDGSKKFTGRSYTGFLEEQKTSVYLTEGYHLLRIDNIQTSSSWSLDRNLLIVSHSSACIPKQPLSDENLYYKIVINGSEHYASPAFKRLNESSVCSLNDSLMDLESYNMGVSYGTVRGSGLFLPINGSAVFVERTGVLDIRSDNSWEYDASQGNRTYLRVSGLIGKSDGSANVSLNCLFNDSEGCRKVEKGSIDLGTAGGKMARHLVL